ncbi:hypothetical protein NPIL_606091 [Nephila pilipes]|uniref:Uncharacterized protein n=1 Tax=Nephila pilipes TaxID=299642 RepID=A0A8X6UB41_NEPPI|nr:hypothetical protein NPIL_606091 [Nephila pilipes]
MAKESFPTFAKRLSREATDIIRLELFYHFSKRHCPLCRVQGWRDILRADIPLIISVIYRSFGYKFQMGSLHAQEKKSAIETASPPVNIPIISCVTVTVSDTFSFVNRTIIY